MTDSRSDKAEVATHVAITDDMDVKGTVRIAPSVLIQLIETTISDIAGVVELTARKGKHHDDNHRGKAFDDGKVHVVVDGDQIDTHIAIVLESGTHVGDISETIRREVGLAAGRMLGMTVRSVDIYVDSFVTEKA